MLVWPSPERIMLKHLSGNHVHDFGGSQVIPQNVSTDLFFLLKFSFFFLSIFWLLLNGFLEWLQA